MQQPMAGDMRMIAAALFIANELERIGDYAKSLARVNIRIGDEPLMKPLIDMPRMVAQTESMLGRALQAFVTGNINLAHEVIREDEIVDDLYDQVYAELMTLIMQDTSKIRQANLLLMGAHNLERAADRCTNICERVIYWVTGKLIDAGLGGRPGLIPAEQCNRRHALCTFAKSVYNHTVQVSTSHLCSQPRFAHTFQKEKVR